MRPVTAENAAEQQSLYCGTGPVSRTLSIFLHFFRSGSWFYMYTGYCAPCMTVWHQTGDPVKHTTPYNPANSHNKHFWAGYVILSIWMLTDRGFYSMPEYIDASSVVKRGLFPFGISQVLPHRNTLKTVKWSSIYKQKHCRTAQCFCFFTLPLWNCK